MKNEKIKPTKLPYVPWRYADDVTADADDSPVNFDLEKEKLGKTRNYD
jgi:hypothetical protein